MKKYMNFIYAILAIFLIASATGCTGGNSASGGVDIKGKKIGYIPPS